MKKYLFFALLALTPLYSFSAPDISKSIYGVWEDYQTGLYLEIKPANRKSIKVKQLNGRNRNKWRRYDKVGYALFDDCNGNTIKLTSRGLRWRKNHGRRTFYLERSYSDYDRRGQYDRNRRYERGLDRNYYQKDNRKSSNRRGLSGQWHCEANDVNIDISYFNDGIRVRRYDSRRRGYDDWYEYKRDRNNQNRYSGRDGKYYQLYDDYIMFHDPRRKKNLKFKKRRR